MAQNKDLEDENNEEYAAGYGAGRSGDVVRDAFVGYDGDSQWEKGYDAGRDDRDQHGWKPADECGNGERSDDDSGGCFLTSACVAAVGAPDDCALLTTLRSYRDTYVRERQDGESAIHEYYCIAPAIVRAINESGTGASEWPKIYDTAKAAAALIDDGRLEDAFVIYQQMCVELKSKYLAS